MPMSTDDGLWPVLLIFTVGAAVYGAGYVAGVLGQPINRETLDMVTGGGIILVAVLYIVDSLRVRIVS